MTLPSHVNKQRELQELPFSSCGLQIFYTQATRVAETSTSHRVGGASCRNYPRDGASRKNSVWT